MGNEEQMNFLDEKAAKKEQKKATKEAKKAAKKAARESRGTMTRVKKGIIVTLCGFTAVTGILGFYAHNKLDDVRTALDIQNLTGPEESITATAENIGDIDGKWVAALIFVDPEYQKNEVNRLCGEYITRDGKDFDNTMNGKTIKVKSTYEVEREAYDGDGYIFADDERALISTTSLKEIAFYYTLSPEISPVQGTNGEDKGVSLNMKFTPKSNG